jgi:hypothetical protein
LDPLRPHIRTTAALVRENWSAITAVAAEFATCETLTYREVVEIIDQRPPQ